MDEASKNHPFLELFDANVDELFRRSLARLKDRRQALFLTQRVFIRSWDEIVEGRKVRARDLYKILNVLLDSEQSAVKYGGDMFILHDFFRKNAYVERTPSKNETFICASLLSKTKRISQRT